MFHATFLSFSVYVLVLLLERSSSLQTIAPPCLNACSNTICKLWPSAVCISIKDSCEARFLYSTGKATLYRDLTSLCEAGNTVKDWIDYANRTRSVVEQDPKIYLEFGRQFHVLVTEITGEVVDYVADEVQTHPTQSNMKRLRETLKIISSLTQVPPPRGPYADPGRHSPSLAQRSKEEGTFLLARGVTLDAYETAKNCFKRDAGVFANVFRHDGWYGDIIKQGQTMLSDESPGFTSVKNWVKYVLNYYELLSDSD